jgi:large subunit ribosomal protein L3
MKMLGLVGKKCGMTRIFTDSGESIPVTVIAITPNRITQIKNLASDGYCALQITAGQKSASRLNKPMTGHFRKAGVEAGEIVCEFRVAEKDLEGKSVGDEILVDLFQLGQAVDVSGITKGKGFAGGIKRHHFAKQDATHGNSLSTRAIGSTGQRQTPGNVFKGKKMPGHLGNVKRTLQNQEVVLVDTERHLLLVRGSIPGAPGGIVIVKPSVKARGEK